MTQSIPPATVERELARRGFRPCFQDAGLEALYRSEHRRQFRAPNRAALALLTLLFDLYWLTKIQISPEVAMTSAILRFGVMTPAAALFILLDWRGRLGRWHEWLLPALLVLPTLIAAVEATTVTRHNPILSFAAIPMIPLSLLATSLGIRQTGAVLVASSLIFGVVVVGMDLLPGPIIAAVLTADVSLAAGVMLIAIRLDARERAVFLFKLDAAHQRRLLAEQNRELARLSRLDALTGVANRRHFDETLARLWEEPEARERPVTLIVFDVDHFKKYNDALGHPGGDECLRAIAAVASRCVRGEGDVLARYGGEEFALILPGASLDVGRAIAERVRRSVVDRAIPHPSVPPPGVVTISLGVATLTPPAGTPQLLIEAADRCLYVAKRNGRDRVVGDADEAARTPAPFSPIPLAPASSS